MNLHQSLARLKFVHGITEADAYKFEVRGYLGHVLAETLDGRLYPLTFYDSVRLRQDLEEEAKFGRPFVADPGLIVLPEVSMKAMTEAVERLAAEGYFDHFVPVSEADLAACDPYMWPPQPGAVALKEGVAGDG